jgi:ergothioneine biosynthesis protein EgtB
MILQAQKKPTDINRFKKHFSEIRSHTESICKPLEIEDYVTQPVVDVSPPKWHLAHTTWFFEQFILTVFDPDYRIFHPRYQYIFNSYYNTVGDRVLRQNRGNLSRPTVKEVYEYRSYVNNAMLRFLDKDLTSNEEWKEILELGLQHEQQHQELLWTDIKYILGTNPLYPKYSDDLPWKEDSIDLSQQEWIAIKKGNYFIGYRGEDFCFDNELQRHEVHVDDYEISNQLVSNREYMEFIADGGYETFHLWLDEGWAWVKDKNIKSPFYWEKIDGNWHHYTLRGLMPIELNEAVKHISFYEANAFAQWKGQRLPSEQEWEIASQFFKWGQRWEITQSPYIPYPGFKTKEGAIGEYNGKFMVNQMTFRGSSVVTSPGHSRSTYRNFFHPHLQWQFTGIRLIK